MRSTFDLRRASLAGAIGLALHTLAQAQAAATAPTTLPPVVVTGNPLGSSDYATPASVLSGDELTLRRGSSLGDTLNYLPGVSSSWFGPNSNRPVIRGLDGDRVRLLSNAGASVDASALSFDHAVPIDPLFVERIEVLRGPAALLYGGSAVGGAVNAIDNRIPDERIDRVSGAAEARFGGAQGERGGAALVEAGNGRIALHADVFGRKTGDLRVPTYTPQEDGTPLDPTDRVRNSGSRTSGGALGGSLFFDQGHVGIAADTYDSRYGVVVEPDVTIRMKRDHVALAGELRFDDAPIRKVKAQLNHTRYEHQEIEGSGEVGTTFSSTGDELRIEAEHAPIGPLRGVIGTQLEDTDFSALGEEAFVPTTRTRKQSLFVLEELPWVGGTLSAGARYEHVRVNSDGDADPADAQFGTASQRTFSLKSASIGNVLKLAPQWSLSTTLSHSERAPTSFELFANGVHAATAAYERGDTTLSSERGDNLDVAVEWKANTDHLRVGAYAARFSRFISLEATGNDIIDGGEVFPEYVFRSVRARLHGIEIDGRRRLLGADVGNGGVSGMTLDLSGKLDITRGSNRDTGEPLPRVAPLRALIGLDAGWGRWGARIEVDHAARQDRVPSVDVPTASYTLLNLALTRRFNLQGTEGLWFLKLDNATDELAYNAASIRTVRDLSPLGGRALKTGVRLTF